MPERNDLKPALRPSVGRAPAAPTLRPAEEDPLVELARIVSGGASFEQAVNSRRQAARPAVPAPEPAVPHAPEWAPEPPPMPPDPPARRSISAAPAPRPVPASAGPVPAPPPASPAAAKPVVFPRIPSRVPTPTESSLAAALEAELLGDLQASFSAARSPLEPSPAPPPAPVNGHEVDFDDFAHMNLRRTAPVVAAPKPSSPPVDQDWDLPSLPPARARANGADPAPPADPLWGAPAARLEERQPGRDEFRQPAARQPAAPVESAEDFFAFDAEGDDPFAEPGSGDPAAAPAVHAFNAGSYGYAEAPPVQPVGFDLDDSHQEQGSDFLGHGSDPGLYEAHGYADHALPPIEQDPGYSGHRGRRGLIGVGAVVVLALAGFVTVVAYRATGGVDTAVAPPVIAADASPTRRAPDPSDVQVAAADPSKLIYDRVDPNEEAASASLVTGGDEAIAPPAPEASSPVDVASREISRIILPGAPGDDTADATAGAAAAIQDQPLVQPIGPRRVRTVVVGADGTIISSESEPTGDAAAADAPVAAVDIAADQPTEVAALAPLPGVPEPGGPIPRPNPARQPLADSQPVGDAVPAVAQDSAAIIAAPAEAGSAADTMIAALPSDAPVASDVPPAAVSAPPAAETVTPVAASAPADAPGADAQADALPADAQVAPLVADAPVGLPPANEIPDPAAIASADAADTVIAEAQPVAPPPLERPAHVAAAPRQSQSHGQPQSQSGPISLLPPDAPPAQPAQVASAAPAAGGFVVQVTAQRSEAQALAAYRDLQRQYPSLLGNREPMVQRADLGDRGVFYRVRVGPAGSSADANQFCNAMKSAGAECLVARN